MMSAVGVILLVLCVGAMVSAVLHGSLASVHPSQGPVSPEPTVKLVPAAPSKTDDANAYDIRVETVIVPPDKPGYDWKASIQTQLDAIEHDDPTMDLVSALTMGGRIVLFYRRRIK